jgi:serum/glucocorticoid-regulated kinase 2
MKFYRGGELFTHLKNVIRFTEKQVKFFAAQILLGLGHLHDNNIIYRDLKPENLLLDAEGNVNIVDFGMAKILARHAYTKSILGTPEYISPEIINFQPYGKTTDFWSFGTLMHHSPFFLFLIWNSYEMLIGIPPFYERNTKQMFQRIKLSTLEFP